MRFLPFACVFVGFVTSAVADAPNVPSDAPYIVLADNLDEPNGYGFCLDTAGRGKTDLMQTHSCKPAAEDDAGNAVIHDTQFSYDAQSQRVESVAFPGLCMQILSSTYTNVFALLDCDDHSRQRFTLVAEDGTLRLAEDPTQCISVTSQTLDAGPWSRRDLALTLCEETENALKKWTLVRE